MCPDWNTTESGTIQENHFTTSYGDDTDSEADWDGASCSDHRHVPGRGIRDVEDLTMLHGIGLNAMGDED